MNPTRLTAIIRKEVYHLLRDYRSLYLAFAIPLLLIMLFGYALSLDVDRVETVVVDYDKSQLSRDFIRKLDASSYFNIAAYLPRVQDAVGYLDRDAAKVAIVIAPDFMKNLQAEREAQLQILIEGSDP
ncbi:MAG TPA: ABC transporter permease, partial [Smithella sp.]|nr:ABC transporter permease [Smithella sp.]